jgi:hypothetical protein
VSRATSLRAASRALLASLPLLATGCLYVQAAGSFGARLDPTLLEQIVPHRTTKAEVLHLLGPPEEFLRPEVREALRDESTRVSGAISLGNRAHDVFTYQHDWVRARGTWLLLYAFVRAGVESDLLVIFFDPDDRVREVSFRRASGER